MGGKGCKEACTPKCYKFSKFIDLKRAGRAGSFAAYRFQWVRGHDSRGQKSVSPAAKLF